MPDPTKPTLLIHTVYFAAAERQSAINLGLQLYDLLTRPRDDRLAFGAGIPVRVATRWDCVDLETARELLVVPVMGRDTFGDAGLRESAEQAVSKWDARLGQGHVIPLFTSEKWREREALMPGKAILRKLYSDEPDSWRHSIIEIVLAACRLLCEKSKRLHLFISHARRDREQTNQVAECIRDFAARETIGDAFFDATDLMPGHDLAGQLKEAAGQGVFVAIRSDSYSSRAWCQRELLWAKQSSLPTLTVVVLERGELRSYPYGGNSPTMLWKKDAPDPSSVVLSAFVQYLKARHFLLDGERIVKNAGLPDGTVVLPRPPELLDLAQGPLRGSDPALVLHPDPELSVAEREVLKEARPRLRLATPSTAYRQLLKREVPTEAAKETARMAAPLAGKQVALSLSGNSEAMCGFTSHHMDDATVYIARCLISAGAAIAYGGDFRRGGFDELLVQLIGAYNQTGVDQAHYLCSYLAATIERDKIPDDLAITERSLRWTKPFAKEALLPPPKDELTASRHALYYSDMRRVMAKHCFARVVLGGQARPRSDGAKEGYGGRYPGVVEEAWRTMKTARPLYIVGGFGGAAALVADLFEGRKTPAPLLDETFASDPDYSEFRRRAEEWENDEYRKKLRLPATMKSLTAALRRQARRRLSSDENAIAWNGLNRIENQALFRSQDPVMISSLVMKGLFRVFAREASEKRKVELVRGSITQAQEVDALAIATFADVPMGGAGADLDRVLSDRVTTALRERRRLVEITSPEVDAEYLILADLGSLAAVGGTAAGKEEAAPMLDAVEIAARQVAETSRRYGFSRIGIVTFGGSVVRNQAAVAKRMLKGFAAAAPGAALVWFELDDAKFKKLKSILRKDSRTVLTTRILERRPRADEEPAVRLDVVAAVRYEDEKIHSIILPPTAPAAAVADTVRMTGKRLRQLTHSGGYTTPPAKKLRELGSTLATEVFGENGCKLLARCAGNRLVVLHDVDSAAIPFETMIAGGHRFALEAGLVRRPALKGLRPQDVATPPQHVGALNLLMVVNPTGDLKGTEIEAELVRKALAGCRSVKIHELHGREATKQKIMQALENPEIDVFHYSGHGFFDGVGDDKSGLICADGENLHLKDLLGRKVFPRIAFFNSCETARVRKLPVPELARAFAEYFLRSGVEAYLGTFWQVADEAAANFAASVYLELAEGDSLDEAVLKARVGLEKSNSPDWANYVLYGSGSFRLVKPDTR